MSDSPKIEAIPPDEPYYVIGVAAELVNLHPQTLRHYEAVGLVVPHRSQGNIRLYSPRDIERLRKITRLTRELGVNLAGVAIILRLSDQMKALQIEIERLQTSFPSGGQATG